MASLKEVRSRIQSVNSTQQITKAMKMVAAAKLRRAQDAIIRMRPYSEHLTTMLQNVTASMDDTTENPYAVERTPEKILIVLVTSDRGLAGAFNTNAARGATRLIQEKYSAQLAAGNVQILTIGKKGFDFMSRSRHRIINDHTSLFTRLSFNEARQAAEFVMNGFINGDFDRVELVYNEFKNVATQIVRREQFLPIVEARTEKKNVNTHYIFEPSGKEIFAELIPKSLKVQFYKALLESNAAENGARMTAMDKATDNAKELLRDLRLVYNRTRQAAITKEILEIVGGAEALSSG